MILQGNDPRTEPSFGWPNRLARVAWSLVWRLLFRPSPRVCHRFRASLLRCFGASIGRDVHIYPDVRIWAPWHLVVGDRVGVANGVTLYSMATITLGDECVVSQGAHLCTGSHDIHSPNFQLVAEPIAIGAKAWVCAEAFIGPGVDLAEGCVLAARGVLVRSVAAPFTVWAGHPAAQKGIRRRTRP